MTHAHDDDENILAAAAPKPEWRCFHCDETFTDERCARDHFGRDETCEPACQIKVGAERSLLTALRRAEDDCNEVMQRLHAESTDSAKMYYAQTSRHQDQLRAAEQLGYERGLRDAALDQFQVRVQPWMTACFGAAISADKVERGDRLLEEVFEALQSGGYDPARIAPLRDYVWSRNVGEPAQEVGGVMVTLAAYCLAFDIDMHTAGETELARIWTKVDQIRAKQAAKPVGSALPIAADQALVSEGPLP